MANGSSIEFEQFDLATNVPTDHHFLKHWKFGKIKNNAVMKEWRILKTDLPDGIYVQVYESNIDLLRAVIVGPARTPYHDGLFFFDMILPCDYPDVPPRVYYHSRGYYLHPNLYPTGKVCLSLINTWRARRDEMWGRGTSTILQVLVSIQGLVLNARPLYNEPKYGRKRRERMYASNRYNEKVFILSCLTMVHTIRRPPEGFEDFVVHHFRRRAASLLVAIQQYQQGGSDGGFEMNATVSPKFKSNLEKILTKLCKALDSFVDDPTTRTIIEQKRNRYDQSTTTEHDDEGGGILSRIFSCLIWIDELIDRFSII